MERRRRRWRRRKERPRSLGHSAPQPPPGGREGEGGGGVRGVKSDEGVREKGGEKGGGQPGALPPLPRARGGWGGWCRAARAGRRPRPFSPQGGRRLADAPRGPPEAPPISPPTAPPSHRHPCAGGAGAPPPALPLPDTGSEGGKGGGALPGRGGAGHAGTALRVAPGFGPPPPLARGPPKSPRLRCRCEGPLPPAGGPQSRIRAGWEQLGRRQLQALRRNRL